MNINKDDKSGHSNKIYFKLIDIDGLATTLAEDAWKQDTKSLSTGNLYEEVAYLNGSTEKVIRREWLDHFSDLKNAYMELINLHKMN